MAATNRSTLTRIARALVATQAAATGLITAAALLFALQAHRDDLAARRAGNPNTFDGLGTGIALFVAIVFGALAVTLIVGAVGLFRGRMWGRVVVAVGEAPILLVTLRLTPYSFDDPGNQILWWLAIAPAAVVLVAVLPPTRARLSV